VAKLNGMPEIKDDAACLLVNFKTFIHQPANPYPLSAVYWGGDYPYLYFIAIFIALRSGGPPEPQSILIRLWQTTASGGATRKLCRSGDG